MLSHQAEESRQRERDPLEAEGEKRPETSSRVVCLCPIITNVKYVKCWPLPFCALSPCGLSAMCPCFTPRVPCSVSLHGLSCAVGRPASAMHPVSAMQHSAPFAPFLRSGACRGECAPQQEHSLPSRGACEVSSSFTLKNVAKNKILIRLPIVG